MKLLILYRVNSETDTTLQAFLREFEHVTGAKPELVEVDSRRGAELAELYDVLQYPAILAVRDDNSLIEMWPDIERWPTISELTQYLR